MRSLEFLQEKSQGVVLATPKEGHLVTAIAEKKNVADTKFLSEHSADQRIKDIETIFTTSFETEMFGC